jgi:hypothetical protein
MGSQLTSRAVSWELELQSAETKSTTEVTTAKLAVELGRGRRAKTGSKKYGAEWALESIIKCNGHCM